MNRFRFFQRPLFVWSVTVVLAAPNLWAQEAQENLPTRKVTLEPAAEPVPALKYQFSPKFLDQVSGNAAQFYYRALLIQASLSEDVRKAQNENWDAWYDSPLKDLPRDEVRKWIDQHVYVVAELEKAFLRERCDWDLGIRRLKGRDVYQLLIPEVQECRQLARMLVLKTRLAMAEGRLDEAIDTLRLGYKLAQDCGSRPFLVSSLVAIAIATSMAHQTDQLISMPGCPNLYWSIASLPRPLIDMRRSLQQERSFPIQVFPLLKDAESKQRTPGEWRGLLIRSIRELHFLMDSSEDRADWQYELAATAMVLKGYAGAKRDLIENGMDAAKLEAMSAAQVVAVHQARAYEYSYDDMYKWTLLPYEETLKLRRTGGTRAKRIGFIGPNGTMREIVPVVSLLLPAVQAARQAQVRLDWKMASLRVIEAIRMHSANNDRKLPKSLDAINVVPVPDDPFTGKPFRYRLEGDTAILDVRPPRSLPARLGVRYEISIAQPK